MLAGTPPLSGGIVAYMIVSEQANAMGRPDLSTLALAVFVLQSFVGYPLTAFFLKKEANYLLKNYRNGIVEGEKERIQVFQGNVIRIKRGTTSATFTVRKVSDGVGVERIFPLNSPFIDRVELITQGRVRRSRLYYLRALKGKAARIKPRGRF